MTPAAAAIQPVYEACPIKRRRRTSVELSDLDGWLFECLAAFYPQTCRQVFYQAVTAGMAEKTESGYDLVCRRLKELRLSNNIPWEYIADHTRYQRRPRTYSDPASAIDEVAALYRKSLWANSDAYVEVWCEKEALTGVLETVTFKYDVPLMIARGFPSLTYLYTSAVEMRAQQRRVFLYYFGDFDPSGAEISRTIDRRIREFAPGIDLTFVRVAVNEDQIAQWNLPTRPTKTSDSRAKNFGNESVEVDAIPPAQLQKLTEDAIVRHFDKSEFERLMRVEEAERDSLKNLSPMLREYWQEQHQ